MSVVGSGELWLLADRGAELTAVRVDNRIGRGRMPYDHSVIVA